jgi:hypothetical protein
MDQRGHYRRWIAAFSSLSGVVLALGFASPGANASCGDWLAHPDETTAMRVSNRAVASRHSERDPAAVEKLDAPSKLPLSRPCHGPYCRSAPYDPAPTAPASLHSQIEKLAIFTDSNLGLVARRQVNSGGDSGAHPLRGFPTRIEHPPRA